MRRIIDEGDAEDEDGSSRMEDRGWKIEDGRSRIEDRRP
jgi:hypothetical protein